MVDTAIPLVENEYVKDLFGILREYGKDTDGLSAIIGHVGEMENFVKLAEANMADMKKQLDELRELTNHPLKNALKKAISSLAATIKAIKGQLSALKASIVESCKSTVAAFKEGGIDALDDLAACFHVKNRLQVMKNDLYAASDRSDMALSKIEAYSKEYHTAGRAVKNFARLIIGKPPIDARKESGRIAKALGVPHRIDKAYFRGIIKAADGIISGLDKLERKAEVNRVARQQPSLMRELESEKERAREYNRTRAVPVRARSQKAAEI
jgi:hypothetical protein